MQKGISCLSCGNEMPDNFCSICGEHKLTPELRSLSHIAKDTFIDLTSLDGKLIKSLRTLIFHPGKFDLDYHLGKRINYIKPVALFFILNLLFVIFSSLSDFYVNFYDQIKLQPYSPYIESYITEFISSKGMSVKDYAQLYDQLVVVLARSLIILQVPIFALLASIILYKKDYYSGDYFVYALNFHGWILILFTISTIPGNIIFTLFPELPWPESIPPLFSLLIFAGKISYLYYATRKLFNFTILQCLWRIPLLFFAFSISHLVYRFLQFIITISLIE